MTTNLAESQRLLQAAYNNFEEIIKKLRTGQVNASILDGINVEVYGQKLPLSHVATIGVVDATLLQITPFDPNNLEAISQAIRENTSLGLNPADDGRVIRVPIPTMTKERRQEVVKTLQEKAEQAKISFRNARQDLYKTLRQQVNDKEISEDDRTRNEKDFEKLHEGFQNKVEESVNKKEQEILRV